ncbi:hypothetical protein CEXT_604351 [Caerostris extrusa]|uniref:Uncharacterized protein n=1 Tax=Caerostris extrusa TaxID=172846 RepID=A0AAV4MUC7_CAEEX|nr:hypothetical protein CEXT_604351 [Caerostris extrusa]
MLCACDAKEREFISKLRRGRGDVGIGALDPWQPWRRWPSPWRCATSSGARGPPPRKPRTSWSPCRWGPRRLPGDSQQSAQQASKSNNKSVAELTRHNVEDRLFIRGAAAAASSLSLDRQQHSNVGRRHINDLPSLHVDDYIKHMTALSWVTIIVISIGFQSSTSQMILYRERRHQEIEQL